VSEHINPGQSVRGTSNELDFTTLLEASNDGSGSFPQFLPDTNIVSVEENLVLPADFAVTQRAHNQVTLAFDSEPQVHRRVSDFGAEGGYRAPGHQEITLSGDLSTQNSSVSNSSSKVDKPAAEKGELCNFPGCQRGPFSSESSRR
jgi:hypothetical protein